MCSLVVKGVSVALWQAEQGLYPGSALPQVGEVSYSPSQFLYFKIRLNEFIGFGEG